MADVTVVQSVVAPSGSTTASRAATITTTAGNCLVGVCAVGNQIDPSTFVDSAGNTWVKGAASGDITNNTGRNVALYYCLEADAVTSVTVTTAGATTLMLNVVELAGVGGMDFAVATYTNGSQQASGTVAVGHDGSALVAGMAWPNGNSPVVMTNPAFGVTFTDNAQADIGTSRFASAYATGAAAGTRGADYDTPGAVSFGIVVASFFPLVLPPRPPILPSTAVARAANY